MGRDAGEQRPCMWAVPAPDKHAGRQDGMPRESRQGARMPREVPGRPEEIGHEVVEMCCQSSE